jgi:Outer membrane protein beta-barrel domain
MSLRPLCLLLALAPSLVEAQHYPTDKGGVLVAGTANLSHFRDKGSNASSTSLTLNPRVGYFVVPGLAVTANLQLIFASSENASTHAYGIGPGVTYYFRHKTVVLNPYLSVRTLYYRETSHLDGFPDRTAEQFAWAGAGGVSLFVARNVALIGELYYQHFHVTVRVQDASASSSAEEYGVQFGVSAFVF